jgi:hypothetical protein
MVNEGLNEFIIDNLQDVKIGYKHLLSNHWQPFYNDEGFIKQVDDARVFVPRLEDDNCLYSEVKIDECDAETDKIQLMCGAISVQAFIDGKWQLFVISKACEAYLCNDNGKTIKKLTN